MKITPRFVPAVLALLVFGRWFAGPSALANPLVIGSDLNILGAVTLDTSSVATATKVTGWESPTAFLHGGRDLASINGAASITFTAPWSLNSGPVTNFFSVGGFTFDLSYSVVDIRYGPAEWGGGGQLVVTGLGKISGNGYEPTRMSIVAHIAIAPGLSDPPTVAVFANVPEGGATALLLGLGLLATVLAARRIGA